MKGEIGFGSTVLCCFGSSKALKTVVIVRLVAVKWGFHVCSFGLQIMKKI